MPLTDTSDYLADRRDECRMDAASEAEADAAAHGLCYLHGLKIGRAVEIALASLECDLVALSPSEKLEIAEGITEACWGALDHDLSGAAIDFAATERGICQSSNRYAEARALDARGVS